MEPALKQVSGETVMGIELLRVLAQELLHPIRQVLPRRLDQEMYVVVHQTVGVTDPAEVTDDHFEQRQKTRTVRVPEKDLLLPVAS